MTPEFMMLVIGAILPPIIDLVNKRINSDKWKFIVAAVFSIVFGSIAAYFQYGWASISQDIGLIFIASQTIYNLIYKNSRLQLSIRG